MIREINAAEFEAEVLKSTKPVAVDFYSTECPPCEALASKYHALAEVYGEDIQFIKVYRQGNRELAEKLGVKGSPTVLFYKDGQIVGDRLSGGVKRSALEKNLDQLISAIRAEALKKKIQKKNTECDVLILGGGPAGLTAGIYTAQAKLNTIVVDRALSGGNVAITHQVSNFPGFPKAQPGYLLAHQMTEQAKHAGVQFREAVDVTAANLNTREITIDGVETIRAKKILVATGSSPRALGIKGEEEFKGRGVSYCATCDAKYYEGKHVVVIGGGNSAIEEALFIAKFASAITIVHQFDKLQANRQAQEEAFANPKIRFLFQHEPREFVARNGSGVDGVIVEDLKSTDRVTIDCDGAFIFAGMQPNLDLFTGVFTLDQWGYIAADSEMRTNVPGVFAAGDVISKRFRQITTAVADGTIAAIAIGKDIGN
ncbi:MAG: hypothetical protein A2X94_10845 [Bdellovibrionales bacterium GWB1_55_8]|nr:MAG: hypothetical protein A2X94_10845 [Bdellovibrionales bacterium GWB1_55_8]